MIVFIDNYDSFSYNLVRYFEELNQDIVVFENDKVTIEMIEAINPLAIIISPGPKTPQESGVCLDVIEYFGKRIPILGICLGHQAIGHVHGAKIIKGKYPIHGKVSEVIHYGDKLFADIPSEFKVTRYHSLIIDSENKNFEVISRSKDGVIMAIKVKNQITYGVQFHPEAYLTEYGHQILTNFLKLSGVKVND